MRGSGGMCGRGMRGRGHAWGWQGACVAGGMCGGGGACVVGACIARV